MEKILQFLRFSIDSFQFGIELCDVEKIIPARPLISSSAKPDFVMGLLHYNNELIAVVDIRGRLGLPTRDMDLKDQFIIFKTKNYTMALYVELVLDNFEPKEADIIESKQLLPGIQIMKFPRQNIIHIYNTEELFDQSDIFGIVRMLKSFDHNVAV